MGSSSYFVLDFVSMRLIGPLTEKEVCVTARVLMQLSSHPIFDIMYDGRNGKEIVTYKFMEDPTTKIWFYQPPPEAASPETGVDMTGLRKL